MNERFGFLKGAKTILDLGAAPGGWLQVVGEFVDEDALIIGVDIQGIEPSEAHNWKIIVGDVTDKETQEKIKESTKGNIDVILSDMAPEVSGEWNLDHYRQIYLARVVLVIADKLLKDEGWAVIKTFQGSEHSEYIREVKDIFKQVRIYKPKASRKKSAEVYVVAHKLKTTRRLPEEFRPKEETF